MFESELHPDHLMMVHRGDDQITAGDILSATKTWFTHPRFDPGAPVIWDLEHSFLDMTIEEMRQIYHLIRDTVDRKRTGGKTAWVHPSGMVRSFIDVIHDEFDWGSEWKTFSNLPDATRWCLKNEP